MIIILVVVLVLFATACSAVEGSATGVELSADFAEEALPVESQLILGSMLLEDSDQAIDSELAAVLLPYWKIYQTLTRRDSAAEVEVEALLSEIQVVMGQEHRSSTLTSVGWNVG